MSKKNLLNESQVRQFMKLASLTPLTPGFVEGLAETHGRGTQPPDVKGGDNTSPGRRTRNEGEDEEAQMHDIEDADADMDHATDLEGDAAEDLEDVAPVSDEPVDVDNADATLSVADVVSAITAALEDLTGQPVEASIDGADVDGAEDEVEADVEMDAELDMGGEAGEEELAVDVEDEEMLEEEAPYGGNEGDIPDADRKKETKSGKPGQASKEDVEERGEKLNKESTEATDDLVEQITKRVAARILKSALTKK
tara:strand:- start:34 stop:795 length:762 start_codon:yes stop_codon:yes gene_type:complete